MRADEQDHRTLREDFTRRAEQAGSQVHAVRDWSEVAELALKLAAGSRVAVPPALAASQPQFAEQLGERLLLPESTATGSGAAATTAFLERLADAAVGVMACPLGVAETGSVLVTEHALPDRAVSMLSLTLVQVIEAETIVGSLDDVADWLSAHKVVAGSSAGYVALVTGPSRTADIERSLTIGVQGPSDVHVVILDGVVR
jgi:L-lactate dehydrogenase complex protein LldG